MLAMGSTSEEGKDVTFYRTNDYSSGLSSRNDSAYEGVARSQSFWPRRPAGRKVLTEIPMRYHRHPMEALSSSPMWMAMWSFSWGNMLSTRWELPFSKGYGAALRARNRPTTYSAATVWKWTI